MSKKFTNVVLTVLTFVCVLCMSIATLGLGNASADTVSSFSMINGAQVRTQGVSGIRFAATLSAEDYKTLNDAGAKFGMIIAPSDYVEQLTNGDADFKRGVMDAYDGTGTQTVFYNWAECTPVVDFDDYDEDNDETEYVLTCSFVGIQEYNFSRTFKARAYYEIDGEYYHTEDITERTIYTIASKYLANTTFDLDDDAQVATKDYVANIVDKVNEVYTDYKVTVTGITDGVAYRDDKISATATVSNGTRTIDAGAKLVLTQEGEEVEEGLAYNVNDGDYTIATSGKFNVVAQNGKKTGGNVAVTVKRHGVEVSIVPGSIGTLKYDEKGNLLSKWNDPFVENVDTSKVTYDDFRYNAVDAMGSSVIIKPTVIDAENADAKVESSGLSLVGDPEWFTLGSYSGQRYLANRNANAKINPLSKVVATYTDDYGIEYTAELPVYGVTTQEPIYYGTSENFTATEELMVSLFKDQWLTIEDVSLTEVKTSNLITFGHLNDALSQTKIVNSWVFRISESGNPSNWVEFFVGGYGTSKTATHVTAGMLAPGWSTTYNNATISGYACRNGAFKGFTSSASNGSFMGWYFDNAMIRHSFIGGNRYNLDPDNYKKDMFGFSIINSEIFVNAGWYDNASKTEGWENVVDSILSKEQQTTNGLAAWSGFDNVTSVDISIAFANGVSTAPATLVIDELAGQKTDASWLNKVYYSHKTYAEGPNLFAD